MARKHPKDFGYPTLDSRGQLVQRYVTPKGLELSKAVESAVPRRERSVKRSFDDLARIRYSITRLAGDGVVDADAIWKLSGDYEHNRVIVTVDRLSDSLMYSLANLYGTEAVAVRVEPPGRRPRLDSRQFSEPPHPGGAKFEAIAPDGSTAGCTLGFAWTTGFVTAGHCLDRGGTAVTNGHYIGYTRESLDENYKAGTGTVPFPGQTRLLGDIALINTPMARVREIKRVLESMRAAGDILFIGERQQLVFHVVPHPSRLGYFTRIYQQAVGSVSGIQTVEVVAPGPPRLEPVKNARLKPHVVTEVLAVSPVLGQWHDSRAVVASPVEDSVAAQSSTGALAMMVLMRGLLAFFAAVGASAWKIANHL
jgi:hypothetical protein